MNTEKEKRDNFAPELPKTIELVGRGEPRRSQVSLFVHATESEEENRPKWVRNFLSLVASPWHFERGPTARKSCFHIDPLVYSGSGGPRGLSTDVDFLEDGNAFQQILDEFDDAAGGKALTAQTEGMFEVFRMDFAMQTYGFQGVTTTLISGRARTRCLRDHREFLEPQYTYSPPDADMEEGRKKLFRALLEQVFLVNPSLDPTFDVTT